MLSNICKQVRKRCTIVLLKQINNNTFGKRAPKFQADGSGGGGAQDQRHLGAVQQQQSSNNKHEEKLHKAGDGQGNADSHKQERIAKVVETEKPVIMTSAVKVAKRIPLIRFPNRKAGEGPGSKAVTRASGGGGSSQAMSSLPSGTASSQPPRTKLSEAEIEAILLGGAAP